MANATGMKPKYEKWSDEETARAVAMSERGMFPREIGAELGRVTEAVEMRLRYVRMTPEQKQARHKRNGRRPGPAPRQRAEPAIKMTYQDVPPGLYDERERRAEARNHMSMTATAFGDPPPGFSALDRKREGSHA